MPINPVSDDNDISSALNIARQSTGADPIQDKIGGLNQFLTGLDLEANTPQFNTGIGGAGMPSAPVRQVSPLGYYSHAAEVAQGLQPSGSASQLISTLKNQPGIKPEELMNAGLIDAQGNIHPEWAGRGKITREDLAGHLQSSMPQVQETVFGQTIKGTPYPEEYTKIEQSIIDKYSPELKKFHDIFDDRSLEPHVRQEAVNNGNFLRDKMWAEIDAAIPNRKQLLEASKDKTIPTRYGQYTLPGGENYREVVLHLPEQQKQLTEYRVMRPDGVADSRYTSIQEAAKRAAEINGTVSDPIVSNIIGGFHSQHFPQPDILAHLRMADRTGPNGEKILHVEEVQSDWGQKGRDQGFAVPATKKMSGQVEPDGSGTYKIVWEDGSFSGGYSRESAEARAVEGKTNEQVGVPTAPYVTNTGSWTDLALKRALKEAAEGGYDKLVWTPGAEQAGRYSLSNHVDRIAYDPEEKTLSYVPKNNNGRGWTDHPGDVEPKDLAGIIGKDAAERLLAEKPNPLNGIHTLEAPDLSFGGEGMKEYYDKIVPNQLKKIAKQHDPNAKIGTYDLVTKKGGKVADEAALNENSQLIEQGRFWDDARAENVNGYRVTLPSGQELGIFENLPDAHDALSQVLGNTKEPDTILKTPFLAITPQMREAIMRGQKAFKRGGRTLGNNAIDNALRLATGGDADSSQPDAPISLQDLKDWKKAHPLSLNKNAMDNIFTSRQSGFEGAEPIAMPADLNELMAYLRRKHHADGGRAHFGFGGDTESDGSRPESGQTGTVSAERSAEAQTQQDNSAAARQDAERASVDNSRGQSAGEQMGQMGRGAGEGNGLAAAIGDSSGGVFGFGSGLNVAKAREAILNEQQAPTDIQDYTTQRLNTPYQGSLLSAAMNPSDAFGMGYGSLVGRQNTRAGAAGFLGSAMGESGKELDPSAINAGSIGMLQETGPRRIGLENTLGIDTSLKGNALRDALAGTQMAQLGYGLNEVQTMPDYRETRNAMATGTNAANVADIALQNFERPTLANQIESAPSREAYAQGIMAGRPSGATLGVGQYDAAPSSFRDALMSGIKQADQQKSRLSGDNTGAMLAGASVSDASNDPAITAARNAAIADGTTPQFNPYAGFSSEDPAEIARYNAAMNAAGPKNAFADMTLGQRAPNTTTNNAFSNAVQGFGNFLTDRLTPSYGINSPEYNKISQAVDVAREPTGGRGDQVYIPPTTATQVQTAPVAPYTTELGTYNQQLPSVGGMTAQQWAAANTGGDMSKVHGRIKYVNGAPMLEYFTQ